MSAAPAIGRRGARSRAGAVPARRYAHHDPGHQTGPRGQVRACRDPRGAGADAARRVPASRPHTARDLPAGMSRTVWLWLLPVVAFNVALFATASAGRDATPDAAPARSAAPAPPPAPEQAPKPTRLALADVRDLPAPLATPEPPRRKRTTRSRAVARPAAPTPSPTATPVPVVEDAPVAPAPSPPASAPAPAPPPPRPAPRPEPEPTPAPGFDDSGTGPGFDDDGGGQ